MMDLSLYKHHLSQFLTHRKALLLLVVSCLLLSFIEFLAVGVQSETMDAERLTVAPIIFFFSNMASIILVSWALIWLMHGLANQFIKIGVTAVSLSFIKASIISLIWGMLVMVVLATIVGVVIPDSMINDLISGKKEAGVGALTAFVSLLSLSIGYVYAIFAVAFCGALLRKQMKNIQFSKRSTLSKWNLPITVSYVALSKGGVWVALTGAFLSRVVGFLGATYVTPLVTLITEPLSLLFFFFAVYLAYALYAGNEIKQMHEEA